LWKVEDYRYGLVSLNRSTKIPKLLFGTSPFIGAGQFGSKSAYYYQQFYLNPVNITRLYMESIEKGLNAIHTPCDHILVKAIWEADNATGSSSFIMATLEPRDIQKQLGLYSNNAETVLLHGSFTDAYLEEIDETLSFVKGYCRGALTGIATHNPGAVIPKIIDKPDIEVILAPVNGLGLFMEPSPESTLKAVMEARAKGIVVFAMKPLAAGRLNPKEAFSYLKDKVDGLVVGVTTSQELTQVIKASENF
jgi:predicted aldo/keto reductase-like oxidoreductase